MADEMQTSQEEVSTGETTPVETPEQTVEEPSKEPVEESTEPVVVPTLLDDIKVSLRLKGKAYDSEVQMHIDSAIADMKRVGIKESMLDPENMSALPKQAVAMFVKARFGYDNDEAPRFEEAYRRTVVDLLNSSANTTYADGEEEPVLPPEQEPVNPTEGGSTGGDTGEV